MIIKLITKLWPSLTPILLYLFWTYIVERIIFKKLLQKKNTLEGQKLVGEKSTIVTTQPVFSLQNTKFLIALYCSVILAIISLLFFALSSSNDSDAHYVPASYENGNIIPSQFK